MGKKACGASTESCGCLGERGVGDEFMNDRAMFPKIT
jgi:hypothetical protein